MNITSYQLVFEAIKEDIIFKKYEQQGCLPSIQALCEQYNVGRNTIRHALNLLEEEQLIQCNKGKAPQIITQECTVVEYEEIHRVLLGKAETIQDIYKTLAFFMPSISKKALDKCNKRKKVILEEKIQRLVTSDLRSNYDIMNGLMEVYTFALSQLHNRVLIDLIQSMLNFVFIPMDMDTFQKESVQNRLYFIRTVVLNQLIHAIVHKPILVEKIIPIFCSRIAKDSKSYIETYCVNVPLQPIIPFTWSYDLYQEVRYIKVCMAIFQDIEHGVYPYGKCLPSIQSLMDTHHVSKNTVRKALDVLSQASVIHVQNGVGAMVIYAKGYDYGMLFRMDMIQGYVRAFRESIEVCKWIVHSFRKAHLEKISQEEYQTMIRTYDDECLITALCITLCKRYGSTLHIIGLQLYKSFPWFYSLNGFLNELPYREVAMQYFEELKSNLYEYRLIQAKKNIIEIFNMTQNCLMKLSQM